MPMMTEYRDIKIIKSVSSLEELEDDEFVRRWAITAYDCGFNVRQCTNQLVFNHYSHSRDAHLT